MDSTFLVYVPVISRGTPCLVSKITLKAHSSKLRQYKLDSFQQQHPHHHVFFPSISPYFGHLDLPKTTMVCINIIFESLQIKRMNEFFPYHLFNFSTADTACALLEQVMAPPVHHILGVVLRWYHLSRKRYTRFHHIGF